MFGSGSKHVKMPAIQHGVNTSNLSVSHKQQFICRWTHLVSYTDDIPAMRSKHAVCFYGDYVYLYGGRYGSLGYRDLWRYCIAQNRWEILRGTGEHPSLLQSHTLVANKGRLYVFGGNFSIDSQTPLWIFNLGSLRWHKYAVCSEVMTPCSRRGHTAVLSHNAMHIYGGYVDLKGSSSELWTFDFVTEGWHLAYSASEGKCGPCARHGHSAVVYDGGMWVFGGMMNLEARSDFWCWNFERHLWKRVKGQRGQPQLCGHSACVISHSMLVFGGSSQGALQNDVWRFHFDTLSWQRMRIEGVPPSPCHYHAVMVVKHEVPLPADRSHSAPQVSASALLDPHTQVRPSSSPSAVSSIQSKASFQNKIQPCREPCALPSNQDKCEFEMFDIRRTRTDHPPLDATRVSCPLCAAKGTMYQLRNSWSVDFSSRAGLCFRKVPESRPLIHCDKYALNENMSLSSFGGSVNPVYESPPYLSTDEFLTDHEEIPLKQLQAESVASMSVSCDSPHFNTSHHKTLHHKTSHHKTSHHNTSHHNTSQFVDSTRLWVDKNRSCARKAKNHCKSSSLESLLSNFDNAEIGGASSWVMCRSVTDNDLVIEDIEETSFSCSEDVRNETDTSEKRRNKSESLGYTNCAISKQSITCKVSDIGKSLVIVTNSGSCNFDPGSVRSTTNVVRDIDLKQLDSESGYQSKMAWLLPFDEDDKENVAMTTFEDEKNGAVKIINPSTPVTYHTWHMSTNSHSHNPQQWKLSTSGAIYQMFVFGGRVDEPQNLPVQPLSVCSLQISTVLT